MSEDVKIPIRLAHAEPTLPPSTDVAPKIQIHVKADTQDTPLAATPSPQTQITHLPIHTSQVTPVSPTPVQPVEQTVVATPHTPAPTLAEQPAPIPQSQAPASPAPLSAVPVPKPGASQIENINFSLLKIAYFSMEIAIHDLLPTYAGGLGVLAGDMMRSATDLGIPFVGISLLYRDGYVKQAFDAAGWQEDHAEPFDPKIMLKELPQRTSVTIEGRKVIVAAWMYAHKGVTGKINPIIFLDTDVEGNSAEDRSITKRLYAGDATMRLRQEAILGIGGIFMLDALGAQSIRKYHMNEGHSALLVLPLLARYREDPSPEQRVRALTVFTTHTPVSAGHDQFPRTLAERLIGSYLPEKRRDDFFLGDQLNMTMVGLAYSGFVNGVAKKHGAVTREMFPGYTIEAITNGVHAGEWAGKSFHALYDKYLPGWESDPYSLRYALSIPTADLWKAHQEAKEDLIALVHAKTGVLLDPAVFTIGFARRATPYKRADFIFRDLERLMRIAEKTKGIQIVFGGKAHPADHDGKLMIQRIINASKTLQSKVKIVFLEDYNMPVAKRLIPGVDLWLNTPIRPQEASGTSGMKAAINGVPQFSILDGWWIEGHIEHVTGWSIGGHPEHGTESHDADDAEDMYSKLEYIILPRFYSEHEKWVKAMRNAIAINGSFFNTHRMVEQYVLNAYFK